MIKKTVVANAGPLIAFGRIKRLSLLSDTLGTIIIPQAVAGECLENISRPGADEIQKAINKKKLIDQVSPLIHELKKSGYYLSAELIREVLRRAKEN